MQLSLCWNWMSLKLSWPHFQSLWVTRCLPQLCQQEDFRLSWKFRRLCSHWLCQTQGSHPHRRLQQTGRLRVGRLKRQLTMLCRG